MREEFPQFTFENRQALDDGEGVDVFEYFARESNPEFDVSSLDPFRRHPFIYVAGTIIDSQWARAPHNLHMLTFPVVVAPVGPQPMLAPTESVQTPDVHFGESIFAENRGVWDRLNPPAVASRTGVRQVRPPCRSSSRSRAQASTPSIPGIS